jgi:hypothetical protein
MCDVVVHAGAQADKPVTPRDFQSYLAASVDKPDDALSD